VLQRVSRRHDFERGNPKEAAAELAPICAAFDADEALPDLREARGCSTS
jgi:hypothetical protein